MAKQHDYPVTVNWQGGRSGQGKFLADQSGLSIDLDVPEEFGGKGQSVNPEVLLTSAVASCFSITFGIMADMRKLPYTGIETKALGHVEENGPQLTYTAVTIKPTITLAPEATEDHIKLAEDLAHKADDYCIITNTVRDKVKISVEPNIVKS